MCSSIQTEHTLLPFLYRDPTYRQNTLCYLLPFLYRDPAYRQNTLCYLLPFLYIDSSIQTEHPLLPVNLLQIFGSLSPFRYCEYHCFYEAFVYKKLFILLKNLSLLICLNQYVKKQCTYYEVSYDAVMYVCDLNFGYSPQRGFLGYGNPMFNYFSTVRPLPG